MWVVHLLVAVALAYTAVVALTYFAQTWLLFPTQLAGGGAVLPPTAERLRIEMPDGERLAGVRIPPASGDGRARPLVLGFGGNAWNADDVALTLAAVLPDSEVAAFHYRGYAPSTGRPSADALMADALLIFDHLQGGAARPIVAVGFSIGSGPAAYLARHRALAGVILVTPFDSLVALAREHYAWAPVRLLLRHRMPVAELMRETRTPTALIVAGRDTIVPARRSEPLRRALQQLVFDRTIADAGHNDLYGHPGFAAAMREALTRIEAAAR